ncbi:MAG: SDR family NAD(P)-dependent oxidoreductase, partial [Chloroflexales bacterium]|nr:SDR family NAD(P)-dependent oxidoreductase [Chloroflexales bacterium]
MKLQDRAAVITGAGSGIGRAMALLFAREGARILAADVNAAAAQETVSLVEQAGGQALPLQVNVTQPAEVQAMLQRARAAFGGVQILCNNAGIGSTTDVVDCEPDEWDRVMAVNVKGVYLGCKYAIPIMLEGGGGSIVNTASVAGMVGIVKRAVYCASKGAVIALTKQVAVEYVEQGVRCNCVCPGTV